MADSILFVDDTADILLGLRVMFQNRFEVETAMGAAQGLEAIRRHGAYSVVISDMRMPGMSGAEFLAQVRQETPDSTRMLLTGFSDMNTAIEAVNEGNIFRFLTKPCEKEALNNAIAAGMQQWNLVRSEKELLEKTLLGNIRVLTEVLAAVSPEIFSKSMRIVRCVKHVAGKLGLPAAWQLEAAAALSQLGCVTVPSELIQQAYVGTRLSPEDQAHYDAHPEVAKDLLADIPRMAPIAWMIGQQLQKDIPDRAPGFAGKEAVSLAFAAKVLKLAVAFDAYRMRTMLEEEAVSRLRLRKDEFQPEMVDALASLEAHEVKMELRRLSVSKLNVGMVLEQEIRGLNGMLKVAKGQEVTPALRIKLHNLVKAGVIEGHVLAQVRV